MSNQSSAWKAQLQPSWLPMLENPKRKACWPGSSSCSSSQPTLRSHQLSPSSARFGHQLPRSRTPFSPYQAMCLSLSKLWVSCALTKITSSSWVTISRYSTMASTALREPSSLLKSSTCHPRKKSSTTNRYSQKKHTPSSNDRNGSSWSSKSACNRTIAERRRRKVLQKPRSPTS